MKKSALIFVSGLICAFLICFFVYKPKPIVIEVIKEKIIYGESTGGVKLTPRPTPQGNYTPKPTEGHSDELYANVPIKGVIETKSAKVEFSGITEVTLKDNLLTLNTTYKDAVFTFNRPKKSFDYYFYVGINQKFDTFLGIEYSYKLDKNVQLKANIESPFKLSARVGLAF